MPRIEAALGFRAHSGWAVMVAATAGAPFLRRRVEMGKVAQPFHKAAEMKLPEAEAYLKRTEDAAVTMAAAAVKAALAQFASDGYQVTTAAVLLGSGKPLPELAKILAAHPLIHTAEGVFFREVLKKACEQCGLAVSGIKERDVPADLVARATVLGKAFGVPWTQDEKLSTAAAWIAIGRGCYPLVCTK
jgi:hypothetical protein